MAGRHYRNIFITTLVAAIVIDALFDLALPNSDVKWGLILDVAITCFAYVIWVLADKRAAKEIEALSSSIREAEQMNRDFIEQLESRSNQLRMVIHDLKNPLGSIQGYSELIEEENANPKSVLQMAQRLKSLSSQTLNLVQTLNELDAASSSESSVRRLDLTAYLEDVSHAFVPQLKVKHQQLTQTHAKKPLLISGHPNATRNLLMNLVSNALKYSPPESEIHLTSFAANGNAVIWIDDEGPGFTAEDKAKAFGRYQKLSARPTGAESSSGLGLHICRDIVLKQRGSIQILDHPRGFGARVEVTFPLNELEAYDSTARERDSSVRVNC